MQFFDDPGPNDGVDSKQWNLSQKIEYFHRLRFSGATLAQTSQNLEYTQPLFQKSLSKASTAYKVWYLKASRICCCHYEMAGWETVVGQGEGTGGCEIFSVASSFLSHLTSQAFPYTLCSIPHFPWQGPKEIQPIQSLPCLALAWSRLMLLACTHWLKN